MRGSDTGSGVRGGRGVDRPRLRCHGPHLWGAGELEIQRVQLENPAEGDPQVGNGDDPDDTAWCRRFRGHRIAEDRVRERHGAFGDEKEGKCDNHGQR